MALDFNAASRRLVVNSTASLSGMTEFSMLAWVKLSATPAKDDGLLYREDSGGALVYRLILDDSSGNMQFAVQRSGSIGFKVNSTLGIAGGEWKCVAVTFDATNHLDMYIGDLDTKLVSPSFSSDTDGSGTLNSNDGLLTIGNNETSQSTRFLTGSISIVKHFDKRLTLEELIAEQWGNYNTADRNYYAELGFQVSGSTQGELSGNGNTGSITGAVISDHSPTRPATGGGTVYIFPAPSVAPSGRIMGSLAGMGGLAGPGGLAGRSGGMAG